MLWIASQSLLHAQPNRSGTGEPCGELITLATHGSTTTRYALVGPNATASNAAQAPPARIVLVLLAGGSGFLNLDDLGCPRDLKGNFLVRSLGLFHAEGIGTALVDAPSDHFSDEGLGGFRTAADHAEDIARVIADLRARTGASVWIVGTSRGTISTANAGARLAGAAAADGIVLTSIITVGGTSRQLPWVSQTVFDSRLEDIKVPALLVGHHDDGCLRTPPASMARVEARLGSTRKQSVIVSAGPGRRAYSGSGRAACEGRSAHGYLDQEAEVVSGIARFVRGGSY